MIERLQVIATFLGRIQLLVIALGILSFVLFLLSLFQAGGVRDGQLMLPAIAGFCWAGLLFSCARLFRHVPARPPPGSRLRLRMAVKLRRSLLWLFAAGIVALGVALVVLTWQLLRTWSMA